MSARTACGVVLDSHVSWLADEGIWRIVEAISKKIRQHGKDLLSKTGGKNQCNDSTERRLGSMLSRRYLSRYVPSQIAWPIGVQTSSDCVVIRKHLHGNHEQQRCKFC